MHRQIIIPDKNNHSVELPERFFGKKIEIIIVELNDATEKSLSPIPPQGKRTSPKKLLKTFGADPSFPTTEEIRNIAWPSKW